MRRLIQRYLHDILIGIEAIQTNKIKSLLTALGIIFGVAAVISMLAIGNGAEHEILEQIKMVGVNNIIISPSTTTVEGSAGESPAASDETAAPHNTVRTARLAADFLRQRSAQFGHFRITVRRLRLLLDNHALTK